MDLLAIQCEDNDNKLRKICRDFIEYWTNLMNMDEPSKHFFIQYSRFIVTRDGHVYLDTLLPTRGNPIFDVKAHYRESKNYSIIKVKRCKISSFKTFYCRCRFDEQLKQLGILYDNNDPDFSFDLRLNTCNIIIAAHLYPNFEMRDFWAKVWCRSGYSTWNEVNVCSVNKTFTATCDHYSLSIDGW